MKDSRLTPGSKTPAGQAAGQSPRQAPGQAATPSAARPGDPAALLDFGRGGAAALGQTQRARAHISLLIVEDDAAVRKACAEIASSIGFTASTVDSIPAARAMLSRGPIDLVLLDLKLPGGAGLTLLEEIRQRYPETIVVVMTAFATVHSAVEAMRIGATDYLTKPFTLEELAAVLDRAAQKRSFDMESRTLRDRLRTSKGMGNLIGRSPAMEKLYRILSKVAKTHHPVLILGESGVGKELVARSIHAAGPLASKPFIAVDCGSLVPSLIEQELFGYVKGAFPGALRSKPGLLAAADGGVVFLDEIGELPLELQARLLRALQDRTVQPMGASHTVAINARILAATNRDLATMVENGRFRKDLYFRLNVVNLRIPPLRERKSDIPLLAEHVLDRMRRESGIPYSFADDTLHLMVEYDWPGNVRELESAIERACALSSGPVLHLGDFPTQLQDLQHQSQRRASEVRQAARGDAPLAGPQVLSIAELEKQAIVNTIRQLKGDKMLAARLLGIGKTTLYRKLKEYNLTDDQLV